MRTEALLNDEGREIPEDEPLEITVKRGRKLDSRAQAIADYVVNVLSPQMQEKGDETLEDSLDFGDESDEEQFSEGEKAFMTSVLLRKEKQSIKEAADNIVRTQKESVRGSRQAGKEMGTTADEGRDRGREERAGRQEGPPRKAGSEE